MARTRQDLRILDPVGLPDSARFSLWAEPGVDFWAGVGDAEAFGEASDQILEGREYEFELPDGLVFAEAGGEPVVRRSDARPSGGTIRTGNYVGRFVREIVRKGDGSPVGRVEMEVRSTKMGYRTHYRTMLRDIAERATELVMSKNRFAQQSFRPDASEPAKTLYERFAFVKALVEGEGFDLAVARIVASPLLGRTDDREETSIRRPGRLSGGMARQLAAGGNRVAVPAGSPLRRVADSLPARIVRPCRRETADIPENRFVKYVLQSFRDFADEMETRGAAGGSDGAALRREAHALGEALETRLSDPFFRELSPLRAIPLSSPALQRREGYREILRAWIFFDAAASLAWAGGDDVYAGGKRNVAQLYEYWLFFKMLDWVCEAFKVRPKGGLEDLLQEAPGMGRLELALRSGQHSPVDAVSTLGSRPIHVRFSYNRTFGRRKGLADAGSWSLRMRPDYTLSLWPEDIGEAEAERVGLAVHLHFDAKYRKKSLAEILDVDDPDLPEDGDCESMPDAEIEKDNQRKAEEDAGVCKRADLLKMHAYNDAIRRTYGSYVLYPGESGDQRTPLRRYHEIIPGLGAFCVRPPDDGTGGGGSASAVKDFLCDIQREMQKRTTQRERSAVHRHRDVLDPPDSVVREDPALPEWEDGAGSRPFVPADVKVLVGVYKSPAHRNWIEGANGWNAPRYNIRLDSGRGSLEELGDALSARYLLLHDDDSKNRTTLLFKLNPGLPPEYVTKADLVAKGYPSPGHDRYLLLQPLRPPDELRGLVFDPKKLIAARDPHVPFVVTFEDLLRSRCG